MFQVCIERCPTARRRIEPLPSAALLAALVVPQATAQAHETRLDELKRFFAAAQLVDDPTIVDCTLSGGTAAQCVSITVKPLPATYTPGPWCPAHIDDGPEVGGVFFQDGEVVDVDGDFIVRLPEIFDDDAWQLHDPATGAVRVTDTLEGCLAAARPNVDPAYRNHCVQCLPEYMADDATMTYVIPFEPVPAAEAVPLETSGAGVAHNGVRLDGPAPVEAILGAYTIAAFDDCGGHLNPHVGYHYHIVTDCLSDGGPDATDDAHGAPIGLAMDGHLVFPRARAEGTVPADLDACSGHATDAESYHYHAGEPGSNAILGCLKAEVGCALTDAGEPCDASAPQRRGPPRDRAGDD